MTTFSHVVLPPCARGTTWSYVASGRGTICTQYWQRRESRQYTFSRLNLTARLRPRTARKKRITDGALISNVTERMTRSWYSSTTSTFCSHKRVTARFHDTRATGSYDALNTKVSMWLASFPRISHSFKSLPRAGL